VGARRPVKRQSAKDLARNAPQPGALSNPIELAEVHLIELAEVHLSAQGQRLLELRVLPKRLENLLPLAEGSQSGVSAFPGYRTEPTR